MIAVTRLLQDQRFTSSFLRRKVAIHERAFGPQHPTVALSRDSLAQAHKAQRTERFGAGVVPTLTLVGSLWLGGFVLLLIAGCLLSRIALRAAARVPAEPGSGVHGLDAALRRVYRVVLWLCCAYYYISLPLIFFVVLGLGGGLVYAFFAVGHIPIKLLVIVLALTVVTLGAIAASVFVKARDDDPGARLTLEDHPKLTKLLGDVAAAVGTRPVDSVYVTPGTDIAVMERGGLLRQLGGRTERCLILGAGILEGMRLGPFRAILAHEYGHFSHQDTAGGGLALAVRRSLIAMAHNLAAGGAAAWYNPAWLFLNGFYRLFLRISHGASRLQEVLADRRAAFVYGARSFEEGLRHVIDRSVRFDAHVDATLKEVVDTKASLGNLYEYQPATPLSEEQIQQAVNGVLSQPPSPYDSHPSPVDRFAWVRALPVRGTNSSADDESAAWSLLSDRAAIEVEMTDAVRENLQARYGVLLPAVGDTYPISVETSATEPVCPNCSMPYNLSDYRADVPAIYCDSCGTQLPR